MLRAPQQIIVSPYKATTQTHAMLHTTPKLSSEPNKRTHFLMTEYTPIENISELARKINTMRRFLNEDIIKACG